MKVSDILSCSFQNWYDKFKKCTIRSIVLPLPSDVLSYLQDNGTLVLPEGSQPELAFTRNDSDSDDESQDWDHCESSCLTIKGPKFEEFNRKVNDSIKKLGGSAFPKLNWSSPKDASWMALNNSLQCYTAGDVYLLLKSSNFVTHDLTVPFKACDDGTGVEDDGQYFMVLKKWMEINPANEFRVFVREKTLMGISQRDVSQHYSCLSTDFSDIRSDIINFWKENIENRFPLSNYIFDIYRQSKGQVILLDFNPFCETTDSLLFSWNELLPKDKESMLNSQIIETEEYSLSIDLRELNMCIDINLEDSNKQILELKNNLNYEEDTLPEFRFITNDTGVQPSPYMQYGIPVDIRDLSTGQDPRKLIDLLQMKVHNEIEYSSEEDTPS